MRSRVLAKTALRDAAMRSDSEAGSDVDAEMVDGGKSDGESNVKDTSQKKKPLWDARKQRHKTWLWRYLGYADATGGGPTARGKRRKIGSCCVCASLAQSWSPTRRRAGMRTNGADASRCAC